MIVFKEAQRFFTYRVNILSGILSGVIMLVSRYALWAALFATGNAGQSSLLETMTYFILADILFVCCYSSFSSAIGGDIRSGDIAQRVIKPCSYHFLLISSSHATTFTEIITRALPMFAVAIIFIGLLPPVSTIAFLVFLISVLFGVVIYTLIDLIISYTVFWLTDYWYVSWFSRAFFLLFGGMGLPLWFYPGWLLTVCEYLPFQYTIYQPLAIYLGRIPPDRFILTIIIQLFWIAVLFACERLVWRMATHKLIVQGG